MVFKGLPKEGIRVFGSQLHTHLTGVQAFTSHSRHGVELPELNRDNHYSPHFQEIRRFARPVEVLPVNFNIGVIILPSGLFLLMFQCTDYRLHANP